MKINRTKMVARPERFELPTLWFEARCSIQLSYGRVAESVLVRVSLFNTDDAERKSYCFDELEDAAAAWNLFWSFRSVGLPG